MDAFAIVSENLIHGTQKARDVDSSSYRRQELGFRTSIYISAASASGAFGGLLAIGLSKIPPWGLIHTWRNIYFFEVIGLRKRGDRAKLIRLRA